MRKCIQNLLFLLLMTAMVGCGNGIQETSKPKQQELLRVYTSIYPLYDFAENIGGDRVQLKNIVPAGSEPHVWEPSPRDVAELTEADIIVLSGTDMEPWADKLLANIDSSKVTVIFVGKDIELIEGTEQGHGQTVIQETAHEGNAEHHDEEEHANEKETDKHSHDHSGKDPHVWLDPLNAKIMVDNIAASFIKADEGNKSFYNSNAEAYKRELDKLHEEIQAGLANTAVKEFITSHAAFGYLAKRYSLKEVPVRELSGESEPSPADMAAVVKLAKEKNINYIFFETMISPKVSEAIAKEIKGETLVLNPLEGLSEAEIAAGKNYLSVMRDNLKNLQIALGVPGQ